MIIGAGFAGLIAGYVFPKMPIAERNARGEGGHRALLRFRSPVVSELTGIPFRRVIVRKGIWYKGRFHEPSPMICNQYAEKVVGRVEDRSIWNIDTVERYIAPRDLADQMSEALKERIAYECDVNFVTLGKTISTVPLPTIAGALGIPFDPADFHFSSIRVSRATLPNCDTFQTVYFPDPRFGLYRASITGDELICEWIGEPDDGQESSAMMALTNLARAFGLPRILDYAPVLIMDAARQEVGKISPIDEGKRKALVARLTREHDIYSLGRFATWRQIMLDDIVHDAHVIKRLMGATEYDRDLAAIKEKQE
jgi:hypothetical protein